MTLLIVYGALMGRGWKYEFVWDDVKHIRDNPLLDGPLIDGILSTQTAQQDPESLKTVGAEVTFSSYRPLLFLSYKLDIVLFGRSATAMHLHNLFLGLINILMLFWILRQFFPKNSLVILSTTSLFALHPAQIETIVYIAARGDILAGTWALLTLVLFIFAYNYSLPKTNKFFLLIGGANLAFLFSLFSKETCLAMPVVLILVAYLTKQVKQWWLALVSISTTLLLYFIIRIMLIGKAAGTVAPSHLFHVLWQLPSIYIQYIKLFFFPFDISSERLFEYHWAGVAWLLAAGFTIFLVFWVKKKKTLNFRLKISIIGLFIFVLILAPSAVVIVNSKLLADHYLYLPIIGLSLFCAIAYSALFHISAFLKRPLLIVIVIWALLLLSVTYFQVPKWKDNITLYAHAVRMEPKSSMAHYRLGYELSRKGIWHIAAKEFKIATDLDSNNVRAFNNLGVAQLNIGRLKKAEQALNAAIKLNPHLNYRSWSNLGLVYLKMGDHHRACQAMSRALRINPQYSFGKRNWVQFCSHNQKAQNP